VSRAGRDRAIAAVTALAVAAGVILQLIATSRGTSGVFATRPERILNVFCFFTVLSNLLLGATNCVLVRSPDRRTTVFAALRLSGVVSIAVTGVVYHLALADLASLHGVAAVADVLLHTVTPILGVAGWLVAGPRGATTGRVVLLSLIYPVAWLVATLIRGAVVGYYPYPFLDATDHGYLRVAMNCGLVALLFLGLAAGARLLERALPATPANGPSSPPDGR
jgi:predicted aconitase with swiveling domain